eukprot:361095-Chlamydomonas_euryale.AAC.22
MVSTSKPCRLKATCWACTGTNAAKPLSMAVPGRRAAVSPLSRSGGPGRARGMHNELAEIVAVTATRMSRRTK